MTRLRVADSATQKLPHSSGQRDIKKATPTAVNVFNLDDVVSFVTKDTSIIREILSPRNAPGAVAKQSLAEATLRPGAATDPHYHARTEEIYFILRGTGEMRIERESRAVGPGDGIAIPPGAVYRIRNTGPDDLVFLCCCAPAYTDDDTVMAAL